MRQRRLRQGAAAAPGSGLVLGFGETENPTQGLVSDKRHRNRVFGLRCRLETNASKHLVDRIGLGT